MFTFAENGFEIVPAVLSSAEVEELRANLDSFQVAPGHRSLASRVRAIAILAALPKITDLLQQYTGAIPFLTRSIFFDKTEDANWNVAWHQDLTIAVRERGVVAGFGPWSTKDGVPHVQPPREILESMITLRLHLDDCDATNGALRVIPRSHRAGKMDASEIANMRRDSREVICALRAGDALLMRPLLLHASSAAANPSHRRVIHLEYATTPLPGGLQWLSAA